MEICGFFQLRASEAGQLWVPLSVSSSKGHRQASDMRGSVLSWNYWGVSSSVLEAHTPGVSFMHVSTLFEFSMKNVNVKVGIVYIRKILKKKRNWEGGITSLPTDKVHN